MAGARRADSQPPEGLLHGLPMPLKDLHPAAGLPTSMGSAALEGWIPAQDGAVVGRLRQAGIVVLGKTHAPEFGPCCYTESQLAPPALSPYGQARGLGSTRTPASNCGLVGFKPSRGRIPSVLPGWYQLGSEGPVARTVGDAALYLDAVGTIGPGELWRQPSLDARGAPPGRANAAARSTAHRPADRSGQRRDRGPPIARRPAPSPRGPWRRWAMRSCRWPCHRPCASGICWIRCATCSAWASPGMCTADSRGAPRRADALHALACAAGGGDQRGPLRAIAGPHRGRGERLAEVAVGGRRADDADQLVAGTAHGALRLDDGWASSEAMLRWSAFTPWANFCGAPAVSLPVHQTASGVPNFSLPTEPQILAGFLSTWKGGAATNVVSLVRLPRERLRGWPRARRCAERWPRCPSDARPRRARSRDGSARARRRCRAPSRSAAAAWACPRADRRPRSCPRVGRAFIVQHVVDQLERGAQRATVTGAGFFQRLGRVGQHGAQTGAGLEQLGGLVADDAQIAVDRDVGVVHVHRCSTSPSAITLVASASTSRTRIRFTDTISWKLREYRKSPTSTLGALPHSALAVLRPRRRLDSSTTSSCSRVEVWMNSMIAASSRLWGESAPSALANINTIFGRMRLPPA
ncbi:amidase domain-containing protein [Ditylenchus destructor]|nr:amidase domain-containing protein [Ditylenchus destructor]